MERKRQLNCNYRPRYFNTERPVVDIQPGENVVKYIRDIFDAAAKEHPISSPFLSTSSCSSPDMTQDQFPLPSEKRIPVSSGYISSAFSAAGSQPQPIEASSSDEDVFPVTSPDEDEICFGLPALLVEELNAPRDPEVAPPDRKGSLFPSSTSQALPFPLPFDIAGSESENEGEFLIAESFGSPTTSWLLQPRRNSLPKERSSPSPLLGSDQAAQGPGIENVCGGDHDPVVEHGESFSKQPQSIQPPALQSSTGKTNRKEKCPKIVPLEKQAERQSFVRDAGRKLGALVLKEGVESEAKGLCNKRAGTPPGDRLIPPEKRSAPVSQKFLVSPGDDCGGSSPQEGSCEAEQAFPSMAGQNSRTLSLQGPSVRAINMSDLSGPVYKAKDIISHSKEDLIRGNMEYSFSEPSVAIQEDSAFLPSVSLKDQVVRPPDDTASLRRSRRLRIKPLEYWRGERVMYKMDTSGGLVASGIISPVQKEPHKPKRIKEPVEMDLGKVLENRNAALKDLSEPAHVFDVATMQEVLQECVSSGRSHLLFFSNEDVSIYKYFSTPLFSVGKLVLKPFKEKGSQYSSTDTLVFHVVKGRLLFTLYGQSYSLCAGNYFYVPAGNIYNIQNILNEECIVVFTQIKGNRPEDE